MNGKICTCLLLLAACTTQGAQQVGPIEVVALSQKVDSWRFGYIEHRLQLRNTDPNRAHTVEVSIPYTSYGGGRGGIERIVRTVVLHPGDAAELSMPQPARSIRGSNQARIEVRGVDSGAVILPSLQSNFETYQMNRVPVFVSRGINSDNLEQALRVGFDLSKSATVAHGYGAGSKLEARLTRAESEIAAWSHNWLAYTCFAGVFLSAEEWRSASGDLRDALLRYASCGGMVVCVGAIDPPLRWALEENQSDGLVVWTLGVGQVLSLLQGVPENWSEEHRELLASGLSTTSERWSTVADIGTAHARFPVIDSLTIPVAGVFYLLLGFAVLTGPVLLIVLARKRRRIWLFWIAPSISALTCGIVVVFALLSDGVTPTRRADTLALLDQVRKEGALVGLAGYYAPLTPGGGLRFASETAVAPFEQRNSHNLPSWSLDFTRDQHLFAGWVQARVPLVMQVRKPFSAVERIDVSAKPDGGIEILNGLGADILSLRLRAADGRWFDSGALAAGRRLVLNAAPEPREGISASAAFAAATAGVDWAVGLNSLAPDKVHLEPGEYVAELAHCPFLERGIEGRLNNRERSLLIGRFAAAE